MQTMSKHHYRKQKVTLYSSPSWNWQICLLVEAKYSSTRAHILNGPAEGIMDNTLRKHWIWISTFSAFKHSLDLGEKGYSGGGNQLGGHKLCLCSAAISVRHKRVLLRHSWQLVLTPFISRVLQHIGPLNRCNYAKIAFFTSAALTQISKYPTEWTLMQTKGTKYSSWSLETGFLNTLK